MKTRNDIFSLFEEQREFIELALNGGNILVDACIESGKTTAIQKNYKSIVKGKRITSQMKKG